MRRAVLLCTLWLGSALPLHGQAFVNLDFEQAFVVDPGFDPPAGPYSFSQGLPGWVARYGSVIASNGSDHLRYNLMTLAGGPQMILFAPDWDGFTASPSPGPDYGLAMMNPESGPLFPTSISQTGLVPASTQSIRLRAQGSFEVWLSGTNIPMVSLGGDLYGGDATAHTGTIHELKIVNTEPFVLEPPSLFPATLRIDDIAFSPLPVPEPSTIALIVSAALSIVAVRARIARRC